MIVFHEFSNPEEIERAFPVIGDLHRYWASLNGGIVPERASVDPVAIKSLLRHILLVGFQFQPFRVRYRLTGTSIDAEAGYNLTGLYLDELLVNPLIDGSQLLAAYERAATTGIPQIGSYRWLKPWPMAFQVPFGIFPLTVGGKLTQAIAIEEVGHLAPFQHGKSWSDCLAAHKAGVPSELELATFF